MPPYAEVLPCSNQLCSIDITRNKAVEQAYFRILNQFLTMLNEYQDKPSQMAIQLDYRKIEKHGHRSLNRLLHVIFNIELLSLSSGKYVIAYAMNEHVIEIDTMDRFNPILRLIYSMTEDKHNDFSIENCLQIHHYQNEMCLKESAWLYEKPKPKVIIHYGDGMMGN